MDRLPDDRLSVSIPDAADLLGVSAWLVRQMVKAGELPALRIRGRVMVPTRALAEWVEKNTRAAS